jgi:hypothetical protein
VNAATAAVTVAAAAARLHCDSDHFAAWSVQICAIPSVIAIHCAGRSEVPLFTVAFEIAHRGSESPSAARDADRLGRYVPPLTPLARHETYRHVLGVLTKSERPSESICFLKMVVTNLLLLSNAIVMFAVWQALSKFLEFNSERSMSERKPALECEGLLAMMRNSKHPISCAFDETSRKKWAEELAQAVSVTMGKSISDNANHISRGRDSSIGNYLSLCILSCGFSLLLKLLLSEYWAYRRMKEAEIQFQRDQILQSNPNLKAAETKFQKDQILQSNPNLITVGEFIQYRSGTVL